MGYVSVRFAAATRITKENILPEYFRQFFFLTWLMFESLIESSQKKTKLVPTFFSETVFKSGMEDLERKENPCSPSPPVTHSSSPTHRLLYRPHDVPAISLHLFCLI